MQRCTSMVWWTIYAQVSAHHCGERGWRRLTYMSCSIEKWGRPPIQDDNGGLCIPTWQGSTISHSLVQIQLFMEKVGWKWLEGFAPLSLFGCCSKLSLRFIRYLHIFHELVGRLAHGSCLDVAAVEMTAFLDFPRLVRIFFFPDGGDTSSFRNKIVLFEILCCTERFAVKLGFLVDVQQNFLSLRGWVSVCLSGKCLEKKRHFHEKKKMQLNGVKILPNFGAKFTMVIKKGNKCHLINIWNCFLPRGGI